MSLLFDGKSAVVTGGTRGIGLEITRRLIGQGAKVLVVGRSPAPAAVLGSFEPDSISYLQGDVGDPDTARRTAEEAKARFGRLDVLVNNAAIDYSDRLLIDTPPEDAQMVMDVNFLGSLYMLQRSAEVMRSQGSGSIVNIASRAGLVGISHMAVYGAAKAALIGLTRAASLELASFNIRVNAVAPGPTETPLMRDWIDKQDDPRAFEASITSSLYQGRLARPQEVAEAVMFLASDAASFVTGVCLPVDGGYTAA